MRHVPDGTLRRFVDEPFAVADADAAHVARCDSCAKKHREIQQNATRAARMLSRPHPVPDLEAAWRDFTAPAPTARRSHAPVRTPPRRAGTLLFPSPRSIAAAALLIAAAAGAGALAAQSPSTSPPRRASLADFQAIEALGGLRDGAGTLGGFDTSSGNVQLPFGQLRWSSSGTAHSVPSLHAAAAATGLRVLSPAKLPGGVGDITNIVVQPRVTATVRLGAAAGALSGRSLTVSVGPAVLVEYGAARGLGLPTLATFTMRRPAVASKVSGRAQLEAYVLAAHGVPSGLSQELRLAGNLATVLPFQAPTGADASQVDVRGAPGILVTAPSIGAAGVIWVGGGLVHAAVGLLDRHDILHVARQLG